MVRPGGQANLPKQQTASEIFNLAPVNSAAVETTPPIEKSRWVCPNLSLPCLCLESCNFTNQKDFEFVRVVLV